jgi:amino acid adenylation domain-containing protein
LRGPDLLGLFAEQARAHGGQPAVRTVALRFTYEQLAREAGRIAAWLQAQGVAPGAVVGLALERDALASIAAVLGVLQAGATVLPLDPEHPPARLGFVLRDARAHLILTHRSLRARLPTDAGCPILCVEDVSAVGSASAAECTPAEIVYLIYTSGSTGEPKGVAMRHEALLNLVRWQCAESGPERAARTLQFTPMGFDVYFQEVFATLLAGGELILVDDAVRLDPSRLLAFLATQRVTRIKLPFVALQQLADAAARGGAPPGELREVITAGEQLLATAALRDWFRAMPACRLVNQYGPSETHVVTQQVLAADPGAWPDLPPIGTPVPGVELFVLDEERREVAVGASGELYVGGVCLAAGYLGQPELTAERFLEDVAVGGARRRLYRTGDLVSRDARGVFEFLGRADQQIKLRGYRIEPGEIEVQLAAHEEVAQAVVVLRKGPAGPRLVAYVVPQPGRAPTLGALRRHLEQRLPAYMVPAGFVLLAELPRTPSGKVDRRALPEPDRARPALGPLAAPQSEEERVAARLWCEMLGLDEVGVLDNFFALGGDSLTAVRMAARLAEAWGREVPVTAPFRRPTIRGLRRLLAEEGDATSASVSSASTRAADGSRDVAVIGMTLRVPGAENVEEFWRLVSEGRDAIARFGREELRDAGVPEELLDDPDYVPARGCIADPLGFDAEFFGIAPREAELMDPQQRLFLEACWTALESAGYAPDAAPGAVGVWGGVSTGMHNDTYLLRVLHARPQGVAPADSLAAMLGNQNDYLTTRVSHKLGLRGPSVSVQSACSTSLLAIAEAHQSLVAGGCDLALAGGACVLFPQQTGYLRQEGDIGSSDGHCRPFDARADGTVFGDGVGVVVLKRLADALADGDRIHAVLKGVAVNNDGAERMSFSAPSADGQAAVVRAAHEAAGVNAASIGYVEAHGTATPIGDPIEVAGLCRAFGPLAPGSCALGSVKSNVGHLIAAAGVTGFVKAVLALERGSIPPTAHFERAHPDLRLERTPFFVNAAPTAWPRPDAPRRAGVSSFGLGGTNVHVVLEQPPVVAPTPGPAPPAVLLPLSARDAASLAVAAEQLAAQLEAHPTLALDAVAVTLQQGRSAQPHRRAVVAHDRADAIARLRGRPPEGGGDPQLAALLAPNGPAAPDPQAVFLFPGGGAQFPGMGVELYRSEPVVREVIERGLAHLGESVGPALRALWLEPTGDAAAAAAAWQRPSLQRPALYLLEVALARLWISWGIAPRALLGHSMGEYSAAHLAGTMSFEDGLGLVALRGRLFETLPPGAMLSVAQPEAALRARLGGALDLAVVNGAESCIASGPRPALERLAAELAREGVDASFVRIEVAAHSRYVEPILAEFGAYLRGIELWPPQIPIASNHSGAWLTDAEACSPGYWVAHLRDTVRFADGLRCVATLPAARLLELGPGRALSSLARALPDLPKDLVVIPSMRHAQQGGGDVEPLLGALGAAWCAGIAPRWDAVLPAAGRTRAELPGTVFRRRRFFAGASGPVSSPAPEPADAVAPAAGAAGAAAVARPRVAPAGTRRERIRGRLAGILVELSGLDPATLDPAQPFLEMGFDSLFLTQASLGFKRAFKVKISFRQLFEEAPTLDALAAYIDGALAPEVEVGEAAEAAPAQATTAAPVLAPAPRGGATPVADRELKFNPWKPIDRGRDGGLTEQQQQHLDALIQRVLARTPRSKEITARHRTHFADPRAVAGFKTLWKEIVYPIAVERSKGAHLWDVDGNHYVDCVGGFGAILFGHAPDFLVEATVRQAQTNLDYGPSSPLAGELARRICAMTGMERVSFCNTGTEAVLATMRLARTVTGREKIVTFSGDYHGLHDEVLVKTQEVGGRIVNLPAAPGIPRSASDNLLVLEYGAPESLEIIRAHADELAAVLVEPVQSRAPELQPREFVQRLRRLTAELGVPLIFDEIITGFRTAPGGAQEWYGVRADLAAYGKVIGAGMPVGIVAGKAEFMDALDGGDWRYGDASFPEAGVTYFAGTFMRHPLALAAVAGALDVMEREGPELQAGLNRRIAAFAAELNDAFESARLPLRMRHFASMIYPKYGGDPEFEELWFHHLRLRGVHIWAGRPGFLTTAHSDEDLRALREGFLAAAEAMVDGGFLKRNDPPADAVRRVPFTEAQEELWLTTRASAGAALSLNEPCAFELRGALNLPVLRRALRKVIERHDALRAAVARDGSGFLVHARVEPPPLEVLDLTDLDETARTAARERIYRDDSRERFDLARAPLLRARLLHLGAEHHELLITVQHLVCDGWSISILFHDLARLYSRMAQGRNPELEPAMQLDEYRAWEQEQQASEEHRETLAFWREQFREPPAPLELPLDAPRPPLRTHRGNRQTRTIPAAVGEALKAFAAERKCTLFSVLLAAYAAFLHRLTGSRDLVIGIPSAGQALLGANALIAHCVHYLPLRLQTRDDESFAALVARVREDMLRVNERQDFTFGQLLKSLRLARDASRPTLISVDFNLDPAMEGMEFHGLRARYVSTPRDFARLELMFNLIEDHGALLLECDHATDVIGVATAARWMEDYERLLRAAVADPARPIGALQPAALPAPTAAPFHAVHELFTARAAATPHAPALHGDGAALDYERLERWSDALAGRLQSAGLVPGGRVGLHMPRSLAMVAAQLATWKAGGVAVPMDPAHPAERRRAIAADAALALLLHREGEAPEVSLGATLRTLAIESAPSGSGRGATSAAAPVAADAPAYVMYTSGSTGVPKGVLVSHGALTNVLRGFAAAFGARADEGWMSVTTPTFDIALVEVYVPLTVGARVVLAPGVGAVGGAELLALARAHAVEVVQATPSTWRMLVDAGLAREDGLRAISGGEALRPALAAALAARTRELWNVYGPTEAAVWTTIAQLRGDEDPVPIGRALPGYALHLLDEALRPVGADAIGELCIAGAGLAEGYLGRPAETERAFVTSPHVDGGRTRLYRTGDRARRLPDGSFVCLGRDDQQFKLRGHRVEAGEIETALERVPGVAEAVVGLRDGRDGEPQLVAWLRPAGATLPDAAALRTALGATLPRTLLPQHFMPVARFPLNASGKVDRAALQWEPEGAVPPAPAAAVAAGSETLLLWIWRELLGQAGVGLDDDFFLLGGSSLLANRMLIRVEEATGVQLELDKVFLHPTIRGLAELVDARLYREAQFAAPSEDGAGRRRETRL